NDVEFAAGKNNGTLTLKIKIANIEQAVNVSVAVAGDAERYVLAVGPNSVDTAITVATDKNPEITIALQGVAKDGYAASGTAITFINYALKAQSSDDYLASKNNTTGYVYTITKDGKLVEDATGVKNQTGNTIKAFSIDTSASDAAVKLDKGVYVVTAYNVTAKKGEALKIEQVGASQSFTVVDNQKTAEVKKNSNAEKLTAITQEQVASAFDVTFDGKALKDYKSTEVSVWYDYNDNTTTAYVKDAYITVYNKTTGNITLKVSVDTLVKKGN
ncbi:MAG: DUF4458 domain-containing protein, partial [Lachnospiraceae bacterium]|nr:DUF4458 domain-containing protein [Lachnospiraceae bacterium]